MRLPRRVLALALLALAGCAPGPDTDYPAFERMADGFRVTLPVDALHPATSPGAEAERLAWITREVVQQNLCPRGYRIETREFVPSTGRYLGMQGGELHYTGQCDAGT
jgi:hypothetical protein